MDTEPTDIVFDSKGNLCYIAEGTVARVSIGIFNRAGRPKIIAKLPDPEKHEYLGIGIDKDDNLYVGCKMTYSLKPSGTVYKVDQEGTITTFENGFKYPCDIAVDPEGTVYISDLQAGKIFRFAAR